MSALPETNSGEVLLDYVHPAGPVMTHVRGLLLMNAIENLKNWGVYETYLDALPAEKRDWLVSTIATSWVPIETAELHYATNSRLGISDAHFKEAGERMADRIAQMYLANALKGGGGIEAFALVLSKNDRMWERMYRGGGCRALRTGPTEFVLEDMGNPLLAHEAFRQAYFAYMRALSNRFCAGAVAAETAASRPGKATLAMRFSWASAER